MKVGFVVPRYGVEVRGGAEQAARGLAERIGRREGWSAEVFTTRALESSTWADWYPGGTATVNGVTVHRLATVSGRHPDFDQLSDPVLRAPELVDPARQEEWFRRQGPFCPAVVEAALASDCDVLAFYPYLYYPTVAGLPQARGRAVLHAAAHDEAPLRLPVFREVFGQADALVFHTAVEQRLVDDRFPVAHTPQIVLGLGAETGAGATGPALAAVGLPEGVPYLVAVGRVDDGKGAQLLSRYFAAYKERHPGPLRLVMAGSVVHAPPPHPDVVLAGPVPDDVKWGLLRGASALVHPSYFESFSIILMEAWLCRLPVVVNGACEVTTDHCRRSGGGVSFTTYAGFEACISRLLSDPDARHEFGACGERYVDSHYRWDRVVDRYLAFLSGLRLAQAG